MNDENDKNLKRFIKYCAVFSLASFIVVIFVSIIILAIRFTSGSSYSNESHYGPTETTLVPFSRSLCQGIRLQTKYSAASEYNVSLHLLNSRPGLFAHETFSISDVGLADNEKHYLFYLRSGSEVTVSACFTSSSLIIPLTGFFIVKGISGYDEAYLARSDIKSVVAEFAIYYDCKITEQILFHI